jgi:hypothetical protein
MGGGKPGKENSSPDPAREFLTFRSDVTLIKVNHCYFIFDLVAWISSTKRTTSSILQMRLVL